MRGPRGGNYTIVKGRKVYGKRSNAQLSTKGAVMMRHKRAAIAGVVGVAALAVGRHALHSWVRKSMSPFYSNDGETE
jgi:hypothetical protein